MSENEYLEDYSEDYEEDNLQCNLIECEYNKAKKCFMVCDPEDLEPGYRYCKGYDLMFENGAELIFKNEDELTYFIDRYNTIQHLVIDADCLRLKCLYQKFRDKDKSAFVQVTTENELLFDFKPSIDGGFVAIDKNQLNLFESFQ